MKELVDQLKRNRTLSPEELRLLLTDASPEEREYLHRAAREVARVHFGNGVFVRGLIEISNYCRNDCRYCGIRRSNRLAERYRLTPETVLACCEEGYRLGFRTFVLQSGEDPALNDELLTGLIREMRRRWPDCAITLSLGERTEASYRALFEAGANRYLLRHETITPDHYRWLHPVRMSLDHRIECLHTLKKIGYQTGTGIMVGSPGQTVDDLVRDLLFIREFEPQMIGIGPFIPHRDTPFGHEPGRKRRTNAHPAVDSAADASRSTDPFDHRARHPLGRRPDAGYFGRCQRGDAQPFAAGRTVEIQPLRRQGRLRCRSCRRIGRSGAGSSTKSAATSRGAGEIIKNSL